MFKPRFKRVFLTKIKNRERIEIWGDGSTVRDFIHVEDLANFCCIAAETAVEGVFNVGSGSGSSGGSGSGSVGSTGQMPPPKLVPLNIYKLPVDVLSFHETTNN